jgi:hypothetical protein
MVKNYQTKLTNYQQTEEVRCIHSSEFFEELKMNGLLENILLPIAKPGKISSEAILGLIVLKKLKGFKTDQETLRYLANNPEMYQKLGFPADKRPDASVITNFRKNSLTPEGEKQVLQFIDENIHDNHYFLIDNSDNLQPNKLTNPLKILSTQKKRRLIRDMKKFILSLSSEKRIHPNVKFTGKQLLEVLTFMVAMGRTANAFDECNRLFYDEYSRGDAPCGHTILNWIKGTFKSREAVEKFNQFVFTKIMTYLKIADPDLFNRRKIILAFDQHLIPTWEDIRGRPDTHIRKTNPAHIIACASDKSRGTILFRKFLTASIVVKGLRFCVGYKAIDNYNNSKTAQQIGELLDFVKQFFPIGCVLADKNFDTVDVYSLLQKRGISYVIPKIIQGKELNKHRDRLTTSKNEVIVVKHQKNYHNKSATIKIVLVKRRNKHFKEPYYIGEDKNDEVVIHGFSTNLPTYPSTKALEAIELYNSRWGIESFYKDIKNYMVKTTTNDSIIRDFFFAHVINFFNLWVFCNLVLFIMLLLKMPDAPKIRFATFADQICGRTYSSDPPPLTEA